MTCACPLEVGFKMPHANGLQDGARATQGLEAQLGALVVRWAPWESRSAAPGLIPYAPYPGPEPTATLLP